LSTTGVSAQGGGGKKNRRVKSVKFDFVPPSDLGQLDIRDLAAGVFATSGDVAAFFQSLSDPDDGSNVGTAYGTCTVLQPGMTFYCNFTVSMIIIKVPAEASRMVVGFNTPTGGSYATQSILGAQGDFQPKGTVSFVQDAGQIGLGSVSAEATFPTKYC
jgi:hypothetical protein